MSEAWRFNLGVWRAKVDNMSDNELRGLYTEHRKIPNSPVLHLAWRALKKRGLL